MKTKDVSFFLASAGTRLHSSVQFAQFDLSVGGGEAPLHWRRALVATPTTGCRLSDQCVGVRDAPLQTLADQDAVLDFGHVQPAGVLGRVHPLQFLAIAARRGGVVAVLQHTGLVDIVVVAGQRDVVGCLIVHIHQFLEDGGKVLPFAMGGHLHRAPAQAGRRHHAQVAVSIALIFVVLAGHPSGPGGLRLSHVRMQRLGQLVHTDDLVAGIHGTLIGVQHLCHGADKVRVGRRFQTPCLWPPRLHFVSVGSDVPSPWRSSRPPAVQPTALPASPESSAPGQLDQFRRG